MDAKNANHALALVARIRFISMAVLIKAEENTQTGAINPACET